MASKYKQIYDVGKDIKNTGYDYSGKILRNSIAKYLYLDSRMSQFLDLLEVAVSTLYNSTKRIKQYFNFTIDEDEIENTR